MAAETQGSQHFREAVRWLDPLAVTQAALPADPELYGEADGLLSTTLSRT